MSRRGELLIALADEPGGGIFDDTESKTKSETHMKDMTLPVTGLRFWILLVNNYQM